MFYRTLSFLFITLCLSCLVSAQTNLQQEFTNPPDSVRPSIYWYWVNDNISTEGVIKDLEAMHEIGIGRAFIGNIGEQQGGYGNVKILTEPWWEAVHAALKTATRLGIDIGMFNSPGWSQSGGPWIKPHLSMRYLACSETKLTGPTRFEGQLPVPGQDFKDVKVLAMKVPADLNVKWTLRSNPELDQSAKLVDSDLQGSVAIPREVNSCTLNLSAGDAVTVRSFVFYPSAKGRADVKISAKMDDGLYRELRTAKIDRSNLSTSVGFVPLAPAVISVPATRSREFRIELTGMNGFAFSEIKPDALPRVEAYAEKTLAKMWPTPLPLWDAYLWNNAPNSERNDPVINPKEVMDISLNMSSDGTLRWDVPEGNWIVLRTGMLTTGVQNGPASPEAKGLEVDKMNQLHVAYHFDSYLGQILRRIPERDRVALKVAVQDSYETGGQNWTDNFIEEFQKSFGYDPIPYMPVMNGMVVNSSTASDRFLWDVRRFIADKVAYDYVGGLRKIANRNNMTTWLECYGHWGFPGEFLQYGGQSDEIAGEFWNEGDLGSIENRAASSCGHIYGKKRITAESFTAAGNVFQRYPALLKKRCDWSYTEGINDTLLHLYIHQPYEEKTPGMNAWFATEFNRKNTWFYQMGPFVEYMRRCMFLLQQGQNVADVAYFIGEDCPKMTGVCDPPLPKGYSFDYINGEVIRDKLTLRRGRLMLPHGTSYRVLVLPNQTTMRPETLKKIKMLIEAGAVVLGPKPTASPSLQNYPECDKEVRQMASQVWGTLDGKRAKFRKVNRGTILSGASVQEALDVNKILPDCVSDHPSVLYVHRVLDNTDIYFLTNQSEELIRFSTEFRVPGRQPELWNPVDGSIRDLPVFEQKGAITRVPLELDAHESAFIVFRRPGRPTRDETVTNFPVRETAATVEGPWELSFESDEIKRGPAEPVQMEQLINLADSENDSIKNYSGKILYKTRFQLESLPADGKLWLHLGKVMIFASVKVNGKDAGSLWTAPWRLDISSFAQQGENTLEIEVVTTWANRLIGDAKLPESERKTWLVSNSYNAESSLLPSGLIGPVTLERIYVQPPEEPEEEAKEEDGEAAATAEPNSESTQAEPPASETSTSETAATETAATGTPVSEPETQVTAESAPQPTVEPAPQQTRSQSTGNTRTNRSRKWSSTRQRR